MMSNDKNNAGAPGLPELLSAVCLHADCPDWIKNALLDGFAELDSTVSYSVKFFDYALENSDTPEICGLCRRTVFEGGAMLHEGCREALAYSAETNAERESDAGEHAAAPAVEITAEWFADASENSAARADGESDHTKNEPNGLERLAAQPADIMHNPLLPENIYNALGDEICQIPDPHTTENVLLNLQSLTEVSE